MECCSTAINFREADQPGPASEKLAGFVFGGQEELNAFAKNH
jgi:hypothetical protein